MQGIEPEAEQLLADIEMPQIGPREGTAGVARAGRIQGAVVLGIFLASDVDLAHRGIQGAVAGIAGGQDTVEHVYAKANARDNVQGRAHAHEISGLVPWQLTGRMGKQIIHFMLALANREAADGKAVKVQGTDFLHGAGTQILEKAALGDAEEKIGGRSRRIGLYGPPGPAACQGQTLFRIAIVCAIGYTFIQHHHDVRVQGPLDFQHLLRGEQMLRTVDVRAELHPFLPYLAQGTQAEDLEAAAVRQDGSVPGGKAVQAAMAGHQFVARAQIEMVGIAQDDGRTHCGQIVGRNGLDGTHRAHGHEDGCGNVAVCGMQNACPCLVILMCERKSSGHVTSSVCRLCAACPRQPCPARAGNVPALRQKDFFLQA